MSLLRIRSRVLLARSLRCWSWKDGAIAHCLYSIVDSCGEVNHFFQLFLKFYCIGLAVLSKGNGAVAIHGFTLL